MPCTTMGGFSLNLITILCVGPRIIKARSLTETTYMGINSQGTSGEVKLGKKRSGSTGDQAWRDPNSEKCDSNRNVDEIW